MKTVRAVAIGMAMLVAGSSLDAQVTGALLPGAQPGPFLALSGPASCTAPTPCTLGPGIGTIVGGATYNASVTNVAAIPQNTAPPISTFGNFLSAAGNVTSTLTFLTPVSMVSFLWGSPDTYNVLTVNHTAGTTVFTATGNNGGVDLDLTPSSGDQQFAQYVQFSGVSGTLINSLTFSNNPTNNAFEVANFRVSVPEPSSISLMGAGLFAVFGLARRRRA
jgi:hypothetical protein